MSALKHASNWLRSVLSHKRYRQSGLVHSFVQNLSLDVDRDNPVSTSVGDKYTVTILCNLNIVSVNLSSHFAFSSICKLPFTTVFRRNDLTVNNPVTDRGVLA